MSNPLVPKQGVDVNGRPYTRNVRADDGATTGRPADSLPAVPKIYVPQPGEESKSLYDGGEAEYEGSHIKLVVSWEGEGEDGGYDEDDESDTPFLRIDVYAAKSLFENEDDYEEVDDNWVRPVNAETSICTRIDARTPDAIIESQLKGLGDQFNAEIAASSVDDIAAKMSGLMDEMEGAQSMFGW